MRGNGQTAPGECDVISFTAHRGLLALSEVADYRRRAGGLDPFGALGHSHGGSRMRLVSRPRRPGLSYVCEVIDLELVCTHEAGHATAHYSLGHPLDYIEIGKDQGHVRLIPLTSPMAWHLETLERAEQEIVATLAGPMATEFLLGRGHREGEEGDYLSIGDLCRQREWDETGKLTVLRPKTKSLILEWEPSIRALAAELMKSGTGRFRSTFVTEVIERTSGRPPVPLDWGRAS